MYTLLWIAGALVALLATAKLAVFGLGRWYGHHYPTLDLDILEVLNARYDASRTQIRTAHAASLSKVGTYLLLPVLEKKGLIESWIESSVARGKTAHTRRYRILRAGRRYLADKRPPKALKAAS